MTTFLTPTRARQATTLSDAAKARMEASESSPFLHSDWLRSVFIHYEVDPAVLQPFVPFELDLRGGKAYVSLVAFHMRNLRPHLGGAVAACLSRPVAHHGFLNVRTYVIRDGEPGIYFLAEWLPNALSVFIGQRTFGLPYRSGRLHYQHHHEQGQLSGLVAATAANQTEDQLRYHARIDPAASYEPCEQGTLTEFLLERYTAYTERKGVVRRFRVWHSPWPQTKVSVEVDDDRLLERTGNWIRQARLIGGHYSPGVIDTHIGRPLCINGKYCDQPWRKPGAEDA